MSIRDVSPVLAWPAQLRVRLPVQVSRMETPQITFASQGFGNGATM